MGKRGSRSAVYWVSLAILFSAVRTTGALAVMCPPLPSAQGTIITVSPSQAGTLPEIIAQATTGATIILQDGSYNLQEGLVFDKPDVTLRSASGDRDSVIIDGNYAVGEIVSIRASGITVADLTLKRAYYHPVHVAGGGHHALLYDLHIVDGREQQVKVNPSADMQYNDFGTLACSLVEITDAGRAYIHAHPTPGFDCYTGGFDAHMAWNWTVRDNTFKGIYCTNGGLAENAVPFWRTCRDPMVERNTIIDCARGIGFGMSTTGSDRVYPDNPLAGTSVQGKEGEIGHIGGTIRNNIIYADIGSEYDSGISLWQAWNVTVAHNTIYSVNGNFNVAIDCRFANTDARITGNLYYPTMAERDAAHPTKAGNVLASAGMFVDLGNRDLHLLTSATQAINRWQPGVIDDIDGEYRDALPDVGADELTAGSGNCILRPEKCGNLIDEDCSGADSQCICGSADSDKDNTVSGTELVSELGRWQTASGTLSSALTTIWEWKDGCT
jgi:hypothetical protein